ncbi:hypothetical protein [Streptomyces scabiei]|uniref:hypothetical protein n=1 Tax=Streptomyces scabiei TaxID=1930 RepID=UPI001B322F17|nr:hypothetical protein [Streptomyces sp. LBUM 1481]MBP5896358.1 hypothetical protein [Streptomyces sp. LBUM 1481]
MKLSQDTVNAVFAAAANTHWVNTNLGPMTLVTVNGVEYTVDIHRSGRYLAAISYASEWDNITAVQGANASQEQHRPMALAATTALGCWVRR